MQCRNETIWMSFSGIGYPPPHEPILDGGEGTPEHIIIGPEMPPRTEDKKLDSVDSSLWWCEECIFVQSRVLWNPSLNCSAQNAKPRGVPSKSV